MKMNKIVAIIILYFFNVITMDAQSIYDFKVESLTGGQLNLADYKEKKNAHCQYSVPMWLHASVCRLGKNFIM